MVSKYSKGDILIVHDPIRLYKITEANHTFGYHATYIGPGTQTVDNALVSITHSIAEGLRRATPAEIVLYTNKPSPVFKIF